MRLTVALEGNGEGRLLTSLDMEDIVKMTITDDIEKSNFNPQMLKVCTDTSYECGYQQGRADAFEKIIKLAHEDVTTGNMIISLADAEKEIKEQKKMGWDEKNDEYLIEFTEQQLAEHDAEIRADAIDEICGKYFVCDEYGNRIYEEDLKESK